MKSFAVAIRIGERTAGLQGLEHFPFFIVNDEQRGRKSEYLFLSPARMINDSALF